MKKGHPLNRVASSGEDQKMKPPKLRSEETLESGSNSALVAGIIVHRSTFGTLEMRRRTTADKRACRRIANRTILTLSQKKQN